MPYIPVPDYSTVKPLRQSRRFKRMMDRAIEIKSAIEALNDEYSDIRADLEPELVGAGVKSVVYQGHTVSHITRKEGKKLDKKKLVVNLQALGVDLSVIDESSDIVPETSYVEIRGQKELTPEEVETKPPRTVARHVGRKLMS